MLADRRVLLGVTGGIAAYKACELVRLLVKAGHDVTPLVTPVTAERFVAPRRSTRSRRRGGRRRASSTRTSTRADLLVIAPLTANTLAKLAHGLADNVLTQAALAVRGPVLVAPAMNVRMWEHPATQANVAAFWWIGASSSSARRRASWPRARSEWGGWPSPRRSSSAWPPASTRRSYQAPCGAGACSSPPAGRASRSTPCASSATARPAAWASRSPRRRARRGADVTLLAANLAVPPPAGRRGRRGADRRRLVARETLARADADVVLMAAAVADYRPATEPTDGKRPKDDDRPGRSSSSRPTTSSPSSASEPRERAGARRLRRRGRRGRPRARAREARHEAGVDLIVFNDVSRADIGFDADRQRGRARRLPDGGRA